MAELLAVRVMGMIVLLFNRLATNLLLGRSTLPAVANITTHLDLDLGVYQQ